MRQECGRCGYIKLTKSTKMRLQQAIQRDYSSALVRAQKFAMPMRLPRALPYHEGSQLKTYNRTCPTHSTSSF